VTGWQRKREETFRIEENIRKFEDEISRMSLSDLEKYGEFIDKEIAKLKLDPSKTDLVKTFRLTYIRTLVEAKITKKRILAKKP